MSNKEFSKKLKSDPKFIPFNENFDYNYIIDYIRNNKSLITDNTLIKKAISSTIFNQYYIELKKLIYDIFNNSILSKEVLTEILTALINRDFYLAHIKVNKSFEKSDNINIDNLSNYIIKSQIPEFGDIRVQSALEIGVDCLNYALNQLLISDIETTKANITEENANSCFKLIRYINIYELIKNAYDMAIWENYDIVSDIDNQQLKIKCSDQRLAIINTIGEQRLERNITSYKLYVISSSRSENNRFYNLISQQSKDKRNPKRLKAVKVINKSIVFKLSDGFDKESIQKDLLFFSEIIAYYPFIGNEKFPKMDNVNLYDVITVFSEIQSLLEKTFELRKEDSESIIQTLINFNVTITRQTLLEYILVKTKYHRNQVKQILKLFIHDNNFFNLWEKPFLSNKEFLIPVYLPLLTPNLLRLVDYWLDQGGFDLETRGKMFEKYIKKVMKSEIILKGYKVNIPERNEYKINNLHEEIDLIIELKGIIIIAEIKCLRYPFNPRDYHNMHERLKNAVMQIKRKWVFINNNKDILHSESIETTKRIIPVVITNYPIFSGQIIDNVPITDISLIDNYITSGKLRESQVHNNGNSFGFKDIGIPRVYYSNEDEFSVNIEEFLSRPKPVVEMEKRIHIEEKLISMPKANPQIYMDFAIFNESIRL